jgi:SSS family solute:Na+ symporter
LFWPALPFIDRVGLAFLLCVGLGMLISIMERAREHPDAVEFEEVDCSTSTGFNFASLIIVLMLTALYATWW